MAITRRSLLQVGAAIALGGRAAPAQGVEEATANCLSLSPDSSGLLRLHRNENAYGPSPRAVAALQRAAHEAVHRYPDDQSERLRSRIAELHGVTREQVVLGCGSREILRMAVDACVGPHGQLVVARPTFDWISECARRSGAELTAVPLRADYSHDLEGMLARTQGTTRLVYILQPEQPDRDADETA